MSLRVVFMGTPDFAVPSLEALLKANFDVAGVYTQPDRPRGRGRRLTFSPVKEAALDADIEVFQPRTLRDEAELERLRRLNPAVIVVVAFGQLLPKAVLDVPPLGCVNVHASLLPRHRGAAPIQAALAAGDAVTGVTTMFMDEGLDTGDIILKRELPIAPEDNAGTLHDRLARAGAELLVETLSRLASGTAPRTPQEEGPATYAPRLAKEDARIRWSAGPAAVANHVRAFAPKPGAYTRHRDWMLKVLGARALPADAGGSGEGGAKSIVADGTIVDIGADGIVAASRGGRVLVTKVQPPGRGPMSGRDYANGYRLQVGERFGEGSEKARP